MFMCLHDWYTCFCSMWSESPVIVVYVTFCLHISDHVVQCFHLFHMSFHLSVFFDVLIHCPYSCFFSMKNFPEKFKPEFSFFSSVFGYVKIGLIVARSFQNLSSTFSSLSFHLSVCLYNEWPLYTGA